MRNVATAKLHPMSEHPEPDTVVEFYYTDRFGGRSHYVALWDGSRWLCKVPYEKDGWGDMPDYGFLGWCKPVKREERLLKESRK